MIGLEADTIPPNIHFKTVKEGMEGIISGRLKVVLENTPIAEDKVVGINNFGFGGNNCHMVIKQIAGKKCKQIVPKDDIPRLVCVSGRTREAVQSILDDINNRPLDVEYVALLHSLFSKNSPTHPYKGYTIMSHSGPLKSAIVQSDPGHRSLLRVNFSGFESFYKILGKNFQIYPVFSKTIEK